MYKRPYLPQSAQPPYKSPSWPAKNQPKSARSQPTTADIPQSCSGAQNVQVQCSSASAHSCQQIYLKNSRKIFTPLAPLTPEHIFTRVLPYLFLQCIVNSLEKHKSRCVALADPWTHAHLQAETSNRSIRTHASPALAAPLKHFVRKKDGFPSYPSHLLFKPLFSHQFAQIIYVSSRCANLQRSLP